MRKRYLIALGMLIVFTHWIPATTVILTPTDDTYVYSSSSTTNYGNDAVLSSGNSVSGNTLHLWTTFLKFDLSTIPTDQTIISATLHMYQNNGAGFLSSGTDAAHVADDSWTEGLMTWDNRPTYGALLGSCLDDKSHRDWSQWDLLATLQWNWNADLIDGTLSVAVMESGGSSTHNWDAMETDQQELAPSLELTYIPEPATISLLAFGAFLAGRKRRE